MKYWQSWRVTWQALRTKMGTLSYVEVYKFWELFMLVQGAPTLPGVMHLAMSAIRFMLLGKL